MRAYFKRSLYIIIWNGVFSFGEIYIYIYYNMVEKITFEVVKKTMDGMQIDSVSVRCCSVVVHIILYILGHSILQYMSARVWARSV